MINNAEIAAVFAQALTVLWDGRLSDASVTKETFVCRAIKRGHSHGMGFSAATMQAIDIIQSRIAPHSTLEDWLVTEHDLIECLIDKPRMQAYRRAWLNSLVKEFESV